MKESELIADCFSGNWTKSAYQQGILTSRNLAQAIDALDLVGDSVIGSSDPHGSKQERKAAFTHGYNTGDPIECVHQYWVTEQWD